MRRLVDVSVISSGRNGMPAFLAAHLAVAGISCIRPLAPTAERMLPMKRVSWRMMPKTKAGSRPALVAASMISRRNGMGYRCAMSTSTFVRSLVLMHSCQSLWSQAHCAAAIRSRSLMPRSV